METEEKVKVKELEAAIGKEVEEWNVEDLDKFSTEESGKLLQYFKDSNVLSECISRINRNSHIADILCPLYIKSLLVEAEDMANEILTKQQDEHLSDEDVMKLCDPLLKGNTYQKVVGYIVLLSLEKYDGTSDEIPIKETVAELAETAKSLIDNSINDCYTLIADIFDVLFPLRTRYFARYEIDVLEDEDKSFEEHLNAFHGFEMNLLEQLKMLDPDDEEGTNG